MAEAQQHALKVGLVVVGGLSRLEALPADRRRSTDLVFWSLLDGALRLLACMREPIAGGPARSASPWETSR